MVDDNVSCRKFVRIEGFTILQWTYNLLSRGHCTTSKGSTNDTAEWGVELSEEYNQINTHDEEEKQLVLEVVEADRKVIPTETTKKAVVAAVSNQRTVCQHMELFRIY